MFDLTDIGLILSVVAIAIMVASLFAEGGNPDDPFVPNHPPAQFRED